MLNQWILINQMMMKNVVQVVFIQNVILDIFLIILKKNKLLRLSEVTLKNKKKKKKKKKKKELI